MAAGTTKKDEPGRKLIASNRRAFRDYHVMERIEAGLVLQGTEVKSLREGKASLVDSYASVEGEQAFLHNLHIPPYECGNRFNHEPTRTRTLLLHKREIRRVLGRSTEKGLTVIPLSLYFLRGKVKVELAIARGKRLYDKRDAMAQESARRDIQREMRGK
ncbi:MAG: SsrA-binding protein SmpB [Candidatus Eisenbacteria bacterium]|jgi:SsrA-binding protein|nr:SsrA-binding protein SmpB [Candidatus Eisenbacteria bacterium]